MSERKFRVPICVFICVFICGICGRQHTDFISRRISQNAQKIRRYSYGIILETFGFNQ